MLNFSAAIKKISNFSAGVKQIQKNWLASTPPEMIFFISRGIGVN